MKAINIILQAVFFALVVYVAINYFHSCDSQKEEGKAILKEGKSIPTDTILPHDTVIIYMDRKVPQPYAVHHWHNAKDTSKIDSTFNVLDSLSNDDLSIYINDSLGGRVLKRSIGYRLKVPKEIHHLKVDTLDRNCPIVKDKPFNTSIQLGLYLTPLGIQPGIGIGIGYDPIKALKNLFQKR